MSPARSRRSLPAIRSARMSAAAARERTLVHVAGAGHARSSNPIARADQASGRATLRADRMLDLERPEVAPELGRELRPLKRQLDRRLQPAHRGPAVVAGPFELVAVDGLLLHERLDRVGQLDLAAGTAL